MATRILLRGDTAADWTTANPVLALREEGVETDTHRRKIGDGVTAWSGLPYVALVPADLDPSVASVVTPGGSQTAAAIAADPALKAAFVAPAGKTTTGAVAPLPFFNVKDYGAKGDGTTDDTAAIQAALNAVPTNGATVFFPTGVYSVPNGGLTCSKPVRIVGQPGLDGTGSRIYVTADAVTALSLTGNRTAVEHLNIAHVLTGTRSASLIGLSVTNANFAYLNDVRVEGFATNCKIADGIYYSVLNSNFRDFVNVGLDYSNVAADAGDGTIQNCTFDRGSDTISGGTCVLWHSGGGMRFVNNKINGKPGGSEFADGVSMVMANSIQTGVMILTGNSVENFTGKGFSIVHNDTSAFQNTIVITGNEFSGLDAAAASTGVYVDEDTSGVVITGNHIFTVQTGIYVERIKHVAISGNSLSNIQQTGIHVGQFCREVVIERQPIDVVTGGVDVLFDNAPGVADPFYEKTIPFGDANGSGMAAITDAAVHDVFEVAVGPYYTVLVEIEATGIAQGAGAWAAKQARMIAGNAAGTDLTAQTVGADYAYQGTVASLTTTVTGLAGVVRFGVQKLGGTDFSGHLRVRVRGVGLQSFKQLARYN